MASVLVPLLIGISINRRRDSYVKILIIGLLISAFTDSINLLFFRRNHLPTAILFHIYTVLEFCVLALLYKHLFHKERIKKNINIVILLFFVFKILDISFFTSIQESDTLAMTLESVVMITFGILYFDQVLREMVIPNLEKHPVFWINSGILIYFSGSLFLFLFSDFIFSFSGQISYWSFWSIHSLLTIIKYTLFSIGLWLQKWPLRFLFY